MPLGMELGLSTGYLYYMGTQPPSPKGCGSPKFSAHVYCGQTAEWIKMALDMEVGLSPGYLVLVGDPAHGLGLQLKQGSLVLSDCLSVSSCVRVGL